MPDLRFDHLHTYAELTDALEQLAAAAPELMTLEVAGTSHEGRSIWLATVTNTATGSARREAGDLRRGQHPRDRDHRVDRGAPPAAPPHDRLRHRPGRDPRARHPHLLRDPAREPRRRRARAARRGSRVPPVVDPHLPAARSAGPGSSNATSTATAASSACASRIPTARGPCTPTTRACSSPRRFDDVGPGPFYRLLPEGDVHELDADRVPLAPELQGLDLNRNFPQDWEPEGTQHGSGPFPASEPEVRAVMEAVVARPNIGVYFAHHTYAGRDPAPVRRARRRALPDRRPQAVPGDGRHARPRSPATTPSRCSTTSSTTRRRRSAAAATSGRTTSSACSAGPPSSGARCAPPA